MRIVAVAVSAVLMTGIFGQEPVVRRDTIWVDTVKRGDMPVSVRAKGVIASNQTAELRIEEWLAGGVATHKPVSLAAPAATVNGTIGRVGTKAIDGMVPVTVDLETPLPDSVRPGAAVEATIHITTVKDVVYVGRPVGCHPDTEGALFKLDEAGRTATRVRVRYGQYGLAPATVVEIRAGLQPGDRVILSDMSAQNGHDRVLLE